MTPFPASVLIVVLDNLGDTVMATAVLRPLKLALRGVRIGMFVKRYAADLLAGHSLIDEVVSADPFWDSSPGRPAGGIRDFLEAVRRVRFARYEAALLLNTEWRRAAAAWSAQIPRRIGFRRRHAGPFLSEALAPVDQAVHFIEEHKRLVQAIVPTAGSARFTPELELSPDQSAWFESWSQTNNLKSQPFAVVHPFSGDERKNWPLDRWTSLASELSRTGCPVVAVCSSAEKDPLSQAFQSAQPPAAVLAGAPLWQVKAVLARARLLIGGDSGPGHIAAALGTPVVSLFGPGNPARSGPVGRQPVMFLQKQPLGDLEVSAVRQAAMDILGRPAAAGGA